MAKEKTAPVLTEDAAPVLAEEPEKLVSIRLPLTKENQAPVFIRVNGRTWLVKRGETVELPECAIEVLKHSEDAMLENIEYMNAHEK